MSNTIDQFTVGTQVRIGNGKVVWEVVRVTTPEQATRIKRAGIAVARDSGQHRTVSINSLDTVTIVEEA